MYNKCIKEGIYIDMKFRNKSTYIKWYRCVINNNTRRKDVPFRSPLLTDAAYK